MPKSCLSTDSRPAAYGVRRLPFISSFSGLKQTHTHEHTHRLPLQAHYISGRYTNSTLTGGKGTSATGHVTHSVSTWQESPHSLDHSLRDHAAETMDVYFLLLVSFVSVFHFSTADQPLEETIVVARNVELLGGWSDANPEREDVQEAAKEAVEAFNTKSKAKKYFKLINIISARTQVTNMINYKIEATIGKTKCRKSDNANIEACGMAKKQLACKFDITLNPMNDDHLVQKMICRRSS